MSEFVVTIADNGFIVNSDDKTVVFEQKYRDDIPQALLESILRKLIDEINNGECRTLEISVDVKPQKQSKCETGQ